MSKKMPSKTAAKAAALSLVPTGAVVCFAGKANLKLPPGFLVCNGDLVPVPSFRALFDVIGTIYGGDGVKTFGLPDLSARVPVGVSKAAANGLSKRALAEKGGAEAVLLDVTQLPPHSHTQTLDDKTGATGGNTQPDGNGGSETGGVDNGTTRKTGGGAAHPNMQPYIVLHYLIKT